MFTEVSQVGPLVITEVYPLEDVSQVDTLVTLEFNPQRTYCCPYSIRCLRTTEGGRQTDRGRSP